MTTARVGKVEKTVFEKSSSHLIREQVSRLRSAWSAPLNVDGCDWLGTVGTVGPDFDLKAEPAEEDAENFLECQSQARP